MSLYITTTKAFSWSGQGSQADLLVMGRPSIHIDRLAGDKITII